jgi:Ser/Thr protein kinase RdoA (MazF antagonist)
VFGTVRPVQAVEAEAELLRVLGDHGFPAERPAHPEPVTTHRGQPVLVTEHVPGTAARSRRDAARLGELLAELAARQPPDSLGTGGAWHHLCPQGGGPGEELDAIAVLLEAAAPRVTATDRPRYDELREAVMAIDDCTDLPAVLIHPDHVPANAIVASAGEVTLIDWAGAGRGPRLWSLAFLLWAVGHRDLKLVDAVTAGYAAHAALEPTELERLADAIAARPVVFVAWRFATGRTQIGEAAEELPRIRARAQAIATRAARTLRP